MRIKVTSSETYRGYEIYDNDSGYHIWTDDKYKKRINFPSVDEAFEWIDDQLDEEEPSLSEYQIRWIPTDNDVVYTNSVDAVSKEEAIKVFKRKYRNQVYKILDVSLNR